MRHAVIAVLLSCLVVGCTDTCIERPTSREKVQRDNVPAEKIPEPKSTPNSPKRRINFDTLLSPDSSLHLPELEFAMKVASNDDCLLIWFLAREPVVRKACLKRLLAHEEDKRFEYQQGHIEQLARELAARKREVNEVWRELGRSPD